jgi:hypothetical protein
MEVEQFVEEVTETVVTLENTIAFAKEYKILYKGFNYKLWKTPIQFYDTLEKNVKQHPSLEFCQKELREIMEEWMNEQEAQTFPTECPYLHSWEALLPIISSRPSYMTSFPSEPILLSLEKVALKQENLKMKELSAMSKQSTGYEPLKKNLKRQKVKTRCD